MSTEPALDVPKLSPQGTHDVPTPARKLASVQTIMALDPIPDADKIEVASVLGWKVVVQKGVHKVGDRVIYCEVDSLLPERPEFAFLEPVKYRIKTRRMRGQISQGIVFPLSILDESSYIGYLDDDTNPSEPVLKLAGDGGTFADPIPMVDGVDLTHILGITKYEAPEEGESGPGNRSKAKGNFPEFLRKTDETRIQSVPSVLTDAAGMVCYIAEKVDGCLDGGTTINTPTGPVAIQELCETRFRGSVLAYNHDTGNVEYTRVTNTSIQDDHGDWYEIETHEGEVLRLTGNHRVWLPELACYRMVSDLQEGDVVTAEKVG